MTERIGNWMVTASGRAFYPLDPRPEEVTIEDIAHALSLTCRFGGHCRSFYSVAQHSVLVARIVGNSDPRIQLRALLHDAAEAYCGDVIWPVKQDLALKAAFGAIEERIERAIFRRFGIEDVGGADLVKYADLVALATEKRDVIATSGQAVTHANTALEAAAARARTGEWHCDHILPWPKVIQPLPPTQAYRLFLSAYSELMDQVGRRVLATQGASAAMAMRATGTPGWEPVESQVGPEEARAK